MKNFDEIMLRELWMDNRLTLRDIANHLGCCTTTVTKHAKKQGFSTRARPLLIEDISQQIFGRLVAKTYVANDKFGKALWVFSCECGREKVLNASAVKAGLTRSCGCYKQQIVRHQSVGLISRGFWRKTQKSALSRDYEFTITPQEAWHIFEKQEGRCALTNVEITLFPDSNKERLQTASPDRIDSSKGYIPTNFQWLHKRVNRMKNILSNDELIFWCRKIASHNQTKSIQEFDTRYLSWD